MDSSSLLHQLRTWTARHRPTLSEVLDWGLGAYENPKVNQDYVLVYVLEHRPDEKRSAARFKVRAVDKVAVDEMAKVHQSWGGIRVNRELREKEIRSRGTHSAARLTMYALLALAEDEVATNIVPVACAGPPDPAPDGWRQELIHTLDSGITK